MMLKNLRERPHMRWQVMDMLHTKVSLQQAIIHLAAFSSSRQYGLYGRLVKHSRTRIILCHVRGI